MTANRLPPTPLASSKQYRPQTRLPTNNLASAIIRSLILFGKQATMSSLQTIQAMMVKQFDLKLEDLTPDATLEGLGLDSLVGDRVHVQS